MEKPDLSLCQQPFLVEMLKVCIAVYGEPAADSQCYTCHMGSITQCYLPPNRCTCTRFTYPGVMEGCIDLEYTVMPLYDTTVSSRSSMELWCCNSSSTPRLVCITHRLMGSFIGDTSISKSHAVQPGLGWKTAPPDFWS